MSGGERGEMSLTSLLVASIILIIVLGATLTMFEGFVATAGDGTRRTEAQDAARSAADRIARDLRNLASPTPDQPQAVDLATGSDLIFKTVDPAAPTADSTNATNTKRVRYCLDDARQLQEQTQTWTSTTIPSIPPYGTCPASGWTRTEVSAASIVNTSATAVFSYDASSLSPSFLTDISEIHVNLLVDTDLTRQPPATTLSTGVFLRNQNRRPTAAFVATKTSGGFVLNGSASTDPEGDALRYSWCDASVTTVAADPLCADGSKLVGSGITFTYTGLAAGSLHQLHLEVADPAGLVGVSPGQGVTA